MYSRLVIVYPEGYCPSIAIHLSVTCLPSTPKEEILVRAKDIMSNVFQRGDEYKDQYVYIY